MSSIITIRKKSHLGLLSGAASMLALTCSGMAMAQTAPAANQAQSQDSSGVEDIIVTAQRREQRLQDVPLAVTAIAGDTLVTNRVRNVTDLTGLAPGLVSRANAGGNGSPQFTMRGIQASASAASQDRQIGLYLDGVYLGGTRGAIFDIPDMERVEVLRGPQGTLFGRNATAGAISFVTRNPTGELGFRQEITVGNFAQFRSRTTFDTPQMGAFSAYFTYVHDQRDGDVRNLGAGTTFDRTSPFTNTGLQSSPKTLGGKNQENIFAAVKFQPSDDFKMTYKFDWGDSHAVSDVRTVVAINPNDFVGSLLNQIIAAQPPGGGRFGPTGLNPGNQRPDAFNNGWNEENYQKTQGHNLTTEWRASDNLTFKNITAYRKSRVFAPTTIAGLNGLEFTPGAADAYSRFAAISQNGPAFFSLDLQTQAAIIGGYRAFFQPQVGNFFGVYEGQTYGVNSQFSTEFQAIYNSKPVDVTVGAIYYWSDALESGLPGYAPNPAFSPLPQLLPLGNVQISKSKTNSYAAYAQADIHLTSQLDLQLGGRITHDKKNTSLEQGGVLTGDRATGTITGTKFSPVGGSVFTVTKPSFTAGLNYKPTRDTLIYGKASTGFLSGGAVGTLTFQPETVLAFEAGLKTEILDRHLRVNIALYQATYKHNQFAQSGATVGHPELGVVVVDGGTRKTKGFEVEVQARLADGLTIGGQVGYSNIKLEDVSPDFLKTQKSYRIIGNSDWVGNVNGQYITRPLFDEATMLFRIDANYQGKSWTITDPDIATNIPAFAPYQSSPARWIVNTRVALRDIPLGRVKGEIAVWSRNLTNNRDTLFPFQFGTILFTNSYQSARTFGADFVLKY
jgi:iron complex outermembrane receptor protein